jgi:hypothetical protein
MNALKRSKTIKRPYKKHGLSAMKRAVKVLGSRAIDRRTQVGKALKEWRTEIAQDLGGEERKAYQRREKPYWILQSRLSSCWILSMDGCFASRLS